MNSKKEHSKHAKNSEPYKGERSSIPEVAKRILPMMFDSKQLAILDALAQSPYTPLSYSQIGQVTGIGLGSSIDYNLDSLRRMGFVYKEEHGTHSYFYLTDAGKIAAVGLYSMLVGLIEDLRSGKIDTSHIPRFVKEDLEKVHERIVRTRQSLQALYLPQPHRPKFFRNKIT